MDLCSKIFSHRRAFGLLQLQGTNQVFAHISCDYRQVPYKVHRTLPQGDFVAAVSMTPHHLLIVGV